MVEMNLLDKNRELLRIVDDLSDNLKEIDALMISQDKLGYQDVKLWYYQHLVFETIDAFAINTSVKIPKYVTFFDEIFTRESMRPVSRALSLVSEPDKLLQDAFNDLRQLLSSQMVKVNVSEDIASWTLETK